MTPPFRFKLVILIGLLVFVACAPISRITMGFGPQATQNRQMESTYLMIEGKRFKVQGNSNLAEKYLLNALEADPANAAAAYELALLAARNGKLLLAEEFAVKATRIDPTNIYYNILLADIYSFQGRYEDSFLIKSEIARNNPFNLTLQYLLLDALQFLSKWDEALALLDHIESIIGFNPDYSILRQELLLMADKKEEAVMEATRLVNTYPYDTEYLQILARVNFEAGNHENTLKIYNQLIEQEPDNSTFRLALSQFYLYNGNFDSGFDHLRVVLEDQNLDLIKLASTLHSLPFFFEKRNNLVPVYDLLNVIDLVLENFADSADIVGLCGQVLNSVGLNNAARNLFMTAANQNPQEAVYWHHALAIDSRLENYTQMLGTSKKALDHIHDNPILYFYYGLANLYLRNYVNAIEGFNQSKILSPDNLIFQSQMLTLIADTYFKKGDHRESFRRYREALELNPENAVALNNYGYFLALRRRNLDKALRMSELSNQLEQNNASFQDTYAWINYKLGNYQVARDWLEKALKNKEEPNATILEHMGDVLYKLGEKEKALEFWEKALNVPLGPFDSKSEYLHKKVKYRKLFE